jgi:hypothetical protein
MEMPSNLRQHDLSTMPREPDENGLSYFNGFASLASTGKIRLLAASPENLERETSAGHQCYLVILDPLLTDRVECPCGETPAHELGTKPDGTIVGAPPGPQCRKCSASIDMPDVDFDGLCETCRSEE